MIYQKKILRYIKKTQQKNLSAVEIPERFIDVLSEGIDYKIATENILVFDLIAGIEDTTKTLPTINRSNAFCLDCCNILKKSTTSHKIFETNSSFHVK